MSADRQHSERVVTSRDPHNGEQIKGWLTRGVCWIDGHGRMLLVAGIALYCVVFGAAACYKYWASWMGFDLAVHLQVLWNTAHGRIAASSPSAGTNSYFGIDIILTELLLAPLYRLVPSVYMLLVLQTVVLGLGAIPVYLFARDRLGTSFAGLTFAAAFLLYTPVEWMNLYEFQIRAFATTFVLCALYALHRRRAGWFVIWSLLALGCRADVGLVVAGMGAMTLLALIGERRSLQRWQEVMLFGVAPIIVGLGWMVICVLVLVPSFRTDGQFLYTKVIYSWLGDTPGAIIRRMLTDPMYVLGYVFGPPAGAQRVRYLLEMFLPFAFLPLLAPRRLLPALPIFALNLLSNTPNLHASTHYHYQALIVPFMLTAAIEAVHWLRQWSMNKVFFAKRFTSHTPLVRGSIVYAALFILALGCNLGFRNPFFSLLTRPVLYERTTVVAALLTQVPPDVSVAATNSLGPRLAQREELYVFPGDDIIYPVAYAERAEYLVVDSAELTSANDRAYFARIQPSNRYRLVDQRFYLDERHQQQDITIWQKIR